MGIEKIVDMCSQMEDQDTERRSLEQKLESAEREYNLCLSKVNEALTLDGEKATGKFRDEAKRLKETIEDLRNQLKASGSTITVHDIESATREEMGAMGKEINITAREVQRLKGLYLAEVRKLGEQWREIYQLAVLAGERIGVEIRPAQAPEWPVFTISDMDVSGAYGARPSWAFMRPKELSE